MQHQGLRKEMTEAPYERPMITALIPAYNEEKTIGRVIQNTKQFVQSVVVVDDGSSDGTMNVAIGAGATVINHPKNLGYGSALATGFSFFKNNGAGVMVVLDGDGQHNPADIPRLVRPIMDGQADVVIGSRFMDGEGKAVMPRYRRFGIRIVNRAWNFASGGEMTDTQCGFRAYSRDAVNKMDIKESNMSASLEILDQAAANNLRVVEIPVSVNYEGNTSSTEPGRHGMELVNYVLRKLNNEHPLLIFGGGGLLVALIGLAFGVYSINSYIDSRYLPFGPTIIAGLLIYVGTLMIFGGFILNSIQSLASRLEKLSPK
jgi:glycosyltransferase involved in cell wall biosynthesis